MIAMLAAAAMAAESAAPTIYQVDLEIAHMEGEMRHATAFDTQIVIRDGSFRLSSGPDGADPLLHGIFDVDEAKGDVFAALKICEPKKNPCEEIADPALTSKIGEPAAIDLTTGDYSITVSFNPLTE